MRSIIPATAVCLALAACSHERDVEYPENDACREGVGDDIKTGAKVGAEGAETGAETAWAGVKQAGRATGGLIRGGRDKAEEEWDRGKLETHQEAEEGRGEIAAAQRPPCPTR